MCPQTDCTCNLRRDFSNGVDRIPQTDSTCNLRRHFSDGVDRIPQILFMTEYISPELELKHCSAPAANNQNNGKFVKR